MSVSHYLTMGEGREPVLSNKDHGFEISRLPLLVGTFMTETEIFGEKFATILQMSQSRYLCRFLENSQGSSALYQLHPCTTPF